MLLCFYASYEVILVQLSSMLYVNLESNTFHIPLSVYFLNSDTNY